jgi:uncharacterized MAPEG superfamily protein
VRNHVEGLALFAPLVLVADAAGVSNPWTQGAALFYLVMRLLHAGFYAGGITPLRSISWGLGFFVGLGAFVFGLVAA